jgi:2-phospho-L-lactate guanylyltransferase
VNAVVLVPVKDHKEAKSRLAALLTTGERTMLVQTMFEDVAGALVHVPSQVAVVTNCAEAAQRAEQFGWRILWESRQVSESVSVDEASVLLKCEGIESVLRLPADLPLVTAADVEEVLSAGLPAPSAVLVPSRDCLGTNALLRTPPDLFPSRFGHNSFVIHKEEACRSGARVKVLNNPNIALDLDEPSDLARLLRTPFETRTQRLLRELKVAERLDRHGSA